MLGFLLLFSQACDKKTTVLCDIYIRVTMGLYGVNGKENGNYYNGLHIGVYMGYAGISP